MYLCVFIYSYIYVYISIEVCIYVHIHKCIGYLFVSASVSLYIRLHKIKQDYAIYSTKYNVCYNDLIIAENACASNPCLNMGDCVTSGTKDFNCICPALYTAKDCSQGIHV